ncbi:hypothetical protein BTVI_121213 [Pitangus sulphuratus]|nr:hypothetical protein BTVI_121213 [Pitangus sulphuratus]
MHSGSKGFIIEEDSLPIARILFKLDCHQFGLEFSDLSTLDILMARHEAPLKIRVLDDVQARLENMLELWHQRGLDPTMEQGKSVRSPPPEEEGATEMRCGGVGIGFGFANSGNRKEPENDPINHARVSFPPAFPSEQRGYLLDTWRRSSIQEHFDMAYPVIILSGQDKDIECILSKFADDTELSGAVVTPEGWDAIQRDPDKFEN